mmetsp:Transcript_36869/g.104051  ORF Transcript_36869/g.104051 Transcript_36869/m.104051 type:complete len:231 (-) Transcript_36869:892-1584(-)
MQAPDMVDPGGLRHYVDLCGCDIILQPCPLVHAVLDGSPLVSDGSHQRCQTAWLVRDDYREVHEAFVCCQPAFNHPAKSCDVYVAPREHDGDPLSLELGKLVAQTGSKGSCPSPLGHQLLVLNQAENPKTDVLFRDTDDLVNVFLCNRKCMRTGLQNSQSVGKCGAICFDTNRLPSFQCSREGGDPFGLHSDDQNLWPDALDGHRHARNEASPANRDNDRVNVLHLGQDL